MEYRSKPRTQLIHRGLVADVFEPDLLFPRGLIVELKRLWGAFAPAHYLQLKAYLKHHRFSDGLLLDFGKESLVQQRFVFRDTPCNPLDVEATVSDAPPKISCNALARSLCSGVNAVASQHGLGFRDTTYRGLLHAELSAERFVCVQMPEATIRCGTRELGNSTLPCLVVEGVAVLMVLAQRDSIRAADRAIAHSWVRHTVCLWGMIVNFGKHGIQVQWVV